MILKYKSHYFKQDGFRDLLSRMLEKTDIDKPLTIHQLRHTFASRALKAGVSLDRHR